MLRSISIHSAFCSQVRLEIGRILAATNTTDLKRVRGISDSFEGLTAKPDETSLELQVWYTFYLHISLNFTVQR